MTSRIIGAVSGNPHARAENLRHRKRHYPAVENRLEDGVRERLAAVVTNRRRPHNLRRLASAAPRRPAVNPVRPGREQR